MIIIRFNDLLETILKMIENKEHIFTLNRTFSVLMIFLMFS